MARRYRCKCRKCGKNGYTDEMFKVEGVTSGGKPKVAYYCNQDEFFEIEIAKIQREELLKYIAKEVLALDDKDMIHPCFIKELQILARSYGWEVVHLTVKSCEDVLRRENSYDNKFNSEFAKAKYLTAIIRNNINPIYNKWKYDQKVKRDRARVKSNVADVNMLNETTVNIPANNSPRVEDVKVEETPDLIGKLLQDNAKVEHTEKTGIACFLD